MSNLFEKFHLHLQLEWKPYSRVLTNVSGSYSLSPERFHMHILFFPFLHKYRCMGNSQLTLVYIDWPLKSRFIPGTSRIRWIWERVQKKPWVVGLTDSWDTKIGHLSLSTFGLFPISRFQCMREKKNLEKNGTSWETYICNTCTNTS